MKRALQALVLLLLLPIPVWSQSTPCNSQGEILSDTVTMKLEVSSQSGSSSGQLAWELLHERTSSGQTNYYINPSSIRFTGDGAIIDALTTLQVFDLIATATVSQGISLGATPCPSSCGTPSYATVVQPSCVNRTGTGTSTSFGSCPSPGCCIRTYSVCCPNGQGSPVVTLISSQSSGCSGMGAGGNCSSTCP